MIIIYYPVEYSRNWILIYCTIEISARWIITQTFVHYSLYPWMLCLLNFHLLYCWNLSHWILTYVFVEISRLQVIIYNVVVMSYHWIAIYHHIGISKLTWSSYATPWDVLAIGFLLTAPLESLPIRFLLQHLLKSRIGLV